MMTCKSLASMTAAVALSASALFLTAARETGEPRGIGLAFLVGTWNCTTTQANRKYFDETDTIAPVGSGQYWVHGTARPRSAPGEPFYDYYIGRVNGTWLYIQIDPSHRTYFVGTSRDGRKWSITFPAEEGTYTYAPFHGATGRAFKISYPSLTQVCTWQSPAPPAFSVQGLHCQAHMADGSVAADEDLSLSQIATPAPPAAPPGVVPEPRYPWWQGIATDGGGRSIYEYNFFVVHSQRISVLINGMNGAYAIATSRLAPTLNGTSWVVVYPKVEDGFTFTDVEPLNDVPRSFTINFKDGYESCAPT